MDIDTFMAYKEMKEEREKLISSKYPYLKTAPIECLNEKMISLYKKLRELNTDILTSIPKLGIRADIYLPQKRLIIRYVDMEDKRSKKKAKLLYERSRKIHFPNALVYYRSTETEEFVLEKTVNTILRSPQKTVTKKHTKVTDCNHSESVQKSAEKK